MSDYTPEAQEVAGTYVHQRAQAGVPDAQAFEEFNRWLNIVKAMALEKFAESVTNELRETEKAGIKMNPHYLHGMFSAMEQAGYMARALRREAGDD